MELERVVELNSLGRTRESYPGIFLLSILTPHSLYLRCAVHLCVCVLFILCPFHQPLCFILQYPLIDFSTCSFYTLHIHILGGQRITYRSWFSPTMWDLGIKLTSSGLYTRASITEPSHPSDEQVLSLHCLIVVISHLGCRMLQ